MSTLTDLAREKTTRTLPSNMMEATVLDPVFTDDNFMRVRVDAQPGYVRECPWAPIPQAAPEPGDAAVVIESDAGNLWVVCWWNGEPSTGDNPSGGSGGGSGVLHGAGAPSSGLGDVGDFYINTTTHAVYGPKDADGWGSAVSMVGPEGPPGADGINGADGAQGPKGDQGDPGPQGPQGVAGVAGAAGPQGVKGDKGDTGATGATGPQGVKGDTGAQGATGLPGVNWRGAWAAATAYAVNDAVTYNGSSYRRLVAGTTATTPDADAINWSVFAAKGDIGATGAAGPTGPVSAVTAEGWHYVGNPGEPAFQNGWVNGASGAMRFRKDPSGEVFIEGSASTGPSASTMFILPAAYRPSTDRYQLVLQDGGVAGAYVLIGADGRVVPTRTQPNIFFQNSFPTDQTTFPAGQLPSAQGLQVVAEGWHFVGAVGEPAFQNGWANGAANETGASFRKLPSGTVQLRGYIKGGAVDTTIFQLPVGYRPDLSGGQYARFGVIAGSAIGQLYIENATGNVKFNVGNPASLSLDSVEFDTGQLTWPTSIVAPVSGTIGDGAATTITYTHGLGTQDVHVAIRQAAAPFELVEARVEATTINTVTLYFDVAPAANSLRVTALASAIAGVAPLVPEVTALPTANLYDGLEIDLVAHAASKTIWRMRYRSADGKWHFRGGKPLRSGPSGAISMNTTTPTVPGGGPSVVAPFTGAYALSFGAYVEVTAGGGQAVTAELYANGAATGAIAQAMGGGAHVTRDYEGNLTGGQSVDFRLYGNNNAVAYFGRDFWLAITPVTLG